MTIWTLIAALSYTLTALWLWHTQVVADISEDDVAKCHDDEALLAMIENRAFLQDSERAHTAAHVAAKASFVLAWPLWLLVSFVAARVLDAFDGR